MERLTYKFNSLSLANFAANTIKKDGVGTILSNNNGFVVVETADVNSVQEIANDARGYEVLRESMTEKKKLTPDQLKKVNTSLRAKMIAKKDAKKEEVEEEEFVGEKLIGKQHKLDFNKDGKLTGKDFEILKTIRKQKAKKEEVEIEEAVDAKQAEIDAKIRKVNAADAVAKIKEIVNSYDKQTKRMIIAGMKSIKESVKEEVEEEMTEAFRFRQQDWEKMRAKYKQGTPVNITLKSGKTVSGTLLRMDKYDQGFATKGHLLHVKTAKGNVKIDDVNVKGIQWNNDPKTKMSEEIEAIDEAMNNYIAFYNGKKMTVQAETSYKAQLKAIEMFKAPASKKHMVTVKLADNKAAFAANEEVEQVDEAAPAIKAGMRLYAKQDKKTDNGSVVKGQYYKVADAGNGLFDLIHQSTGYRKAMHKVTASAIQAMIQNKIF
jgi:hypothetical protein